MVQKILSTLALFFLLTIGVINWNLYQIEAKADDIKLLLKYFDKRIKISSKNDIIMIQNILIDSVKHEYNENNILDLAVILGSKKGLCFERSFVLQKIFTYNKIKFRPVFIFYSNKSKTSYFDLFNEHLSSHAGLEVYFDGHWYYLDTNTKQSNLISFEKFLYTYKTIPKDAKLIRYLSNRHGRFLYPSFIPDIY